MGANGRTKELGLGGGGVCFNGSNLGDVIKGREKKCK